MSGCECKPDRAQPSRYRTETIRPVGPTLTLTSFAQQVSQTSQISIRRYATANKDLQFPTAIPIWKLNGSMVLRASAMAAHFGWRLRIGGC